MLLEPVGKFQKNEKGILAVEFSATDAPLHMGSVVLEILMSGKTLSNQDVIATLINRLELENDVMVLDTYRQLLEFMVYLSIAEN
jgi:hypothetical protein